MACWFLQDAWRRTVGQPGEELPLTLAPERRMTAKLLDQQWSDEFEQLMRNRLMMGCLRYGGLKGTGDTVKKAYDRVASMIVRLKRYEDTGNLEDLVDVANLCLVEFVEGNHPHSHFQARDENNHHASIKNKT